MVDTASTIKKVFDGIGLTGRLLDESDDFNLVRVLSLVYAESSRSGCVNLRWLLSVVAPATARMNATDSRYHTLYVRLYRRVNKLRDLGFVWVEKRDDGLLWVGVTEKLLHLIQQASFSNKCDRSKNKPDSVFSLPRRARPERIEAIKVALGVKMLDDDVKERLKEWFERYLDYADGRVVVLRRSDFAPNDAPPYLILPYITRFTDDSVKVKNLKKFETIWDFSRSRYEYAVFVTLTTDPKRFKSAWHGWRHLSVAFNRFMSYLRRIYGFRPPYVAVYEFTKSGLLHVHLVLFGVRYLMHYRRLSFLWSKEGQGKIVYVYTLRNDGNGWHWARMRPKDAKKGESADDYLKKYLKKALYDVEGLYLYWVSNKRFFSYSRVFSQLFPRKSVSLGWYAFLGTFKTFELPVFVLTRDTFVSSRLLRDYADDVTPPPS